MKKKTVKTLIALFPFSIKKFFKWIVNHCPSVNISLSFFHWFICKIFNIWIEKFYFLINLMSKKIYQSYIFNVGYLMKHIY